MVKSTFTKAGMTLNPSKFQFRVVNDKGRIPRNFSLQLGDTKIKRTESIVLPGVKIDEKLSFHEDTSDVLWKSF
jgi:hypothetical protein